MYLMKGNYVEVYKTDFDKRGRAECVGCPYRSGGGRFRGGLFFAWDRCRNDACSLNREEKESRKRWK